TVNAQSLRARLERHEQQVSRRQHSPPLGLLCFFVVSTKMKVAICLAFLSVAVMAVMIFQAVRQELNLRVLKSRMVENTEQVKRKEDAIIEVKSKIQAMKSKLVFVNTNIDTLKKKKTDGEQKAQELNKNLQTCNTEKQDVEKKTSGMRESLNKLKADHEQAKKKAQEDIQSLKQQILDRDKAICAFADTTKEEARKLCGLK
ncbi:hypothetical protein FQN60_016990, partial [Etheostoma spectabile]